MWERRRRREGEEGRRYNSDTLMLSSMLCSNMALKTGERAVGGGEGREEVEGRERRRRGRRTRGGGEKGERRERGKEGEGEGRE